MKFEDKTKKRWEAKTFFGMMSLLAYSEKLFLRGLGRKVQITMPGFPLRISNPTQRTPETKLHKKTMRQQRRARINRRGW